VQGEEDGVAKFRGESLQWFQAMAHLQQLSTAMAASVQMLQSIRTTMDEATAEADKLVKELKTVPKQEILPHFYRTGQLLEVR
jgi:hypothetical protein